MKSISIKPGRTGSLPRFFPMFDAVVQQLGPTSAAVYGLIWRSCQDTGGLCGTSAHALSLRLGLADLTVAQHIKRLVEEGYLERVSAGGRGRAQVFRLTRKFESMVELASIEDALAREG